MSQPAPLLRMTGISKSFGATRALSDVHLDVSAGQVLALIGENGAGKSTLMKVLSGAHRPDSGVMQLDGNRYAPAGPHEARLAGVAMIYQELNLAPDLSVEDNVMLGQEEHFFGLLNHARGRLRVRETLQLLGHPELNPHAIVKHLSVGAQQLAEIARALVLNARIIVFDEPTSSLPRRDVEHLFGVIRKLRTAGLGIVYISHFLEEVRAVADDFLVLRDGENAGSGSLKDVTDAEIVASMVGRNVEELFPRVAHTPGEPLLQIAKLSGRGTPRQVSFELRRGEILGIAGLVGAGRTELLRCLFGLRHVHSGVVHVAGRSPKATPVARIAAGFGFVSEDRKTEGLAQQLSLEDNMTLSRLAPYQLAGWLRHGFRRRAVHHWMKRLKIKALHSRQEVETLSGGNQQKVAIARVLHQEADVLLLDEPTRGIDVGTKAEVYRLIGQLAAEGKAVIFVSSYLPELLAVCDRVAVMARGRLRAIRPVEQWTEEAVMECAIASDVPDQ